MGSDVYYQLYYHIVWATKNRQAVITQSMRGCVEAEVEAACRKHGGAALAWFAMPEHVHLVVSLPPSECLATFIGRVKGASSHNIRAALSEEHAFGWQDGYGIITFRKGELDKVTRYVQEQERRHAERKISRLMETISQQEHNRSSHTQGH
jgi:putative transposase